MKRVALFILTLALAIMACGSEGEVSPPPVPTKVRSTNSRPIPIQRMGDDGCRWKLDGGAWYCNNVSQGWMMAYQDGMFGFLVDFELLDSDQAAKRYVDWFSINGVSSSQMDWIQTIEDDAYYGQSEAFECQRSLCCMAKFEDGLLTTNCGYE